MVRTYQTKTKQFKFKPRRLVRCSGVIGGLLLLMLGLLGPLPRSTNHAAAEPAADASTITACAGNPECLAFSLDTTLDYNGEHTNLATTFALGGATNPASNWIVNYGDNTGDQLITGGTGPGVSHTYAVPGVYQVTVRPNGPMVAGWLDALSLSGAAVISLDTPLTDQMFSHQPTSRQGRFEQVFSGIQNLVSLPDNLFQNILITSPTDCRSLFAYTFQGSAVNSPTATIPADLFASLNTSLCTDFSQMFYYTFMSYGGASTVGTIPDNLFKSIQTNQGTDFDMMFYWTFADYAMQSTVGTIPADLFGPIDTTNAADGRASQMFNRTFQNYAKRTARFWVDGAPVDTLTQEFNSPYWLKNLTTDDGPSDMILTQPGDQVAPSYPAWDLTINDPADWDLAYAGYNWYRTDGMSCAVANPTPDCGVQNTSTLATFPVDEWTKDTATIWGSVNFYGGRSTAVATVTFEANGGSPVASLTGVNIGSVINPPINPTRDGYVFVGWFSDAELTTDWNFTTDTVPGDLTLYAKWIQPATPTQPPVPPVVPGVPDTGI